MNKANKTLSTALISARMVTLFGMLSLISVNASAEEETTLARIQREGVLHAATEPAFEPFEFMQDGQVVGYGTDILHEVASRLHVRLDQMSMPLSAVLPGLLAHKADLAATTLVTTPERAKKVAFTHPIADVKKVIFVRQDEARIATTSDLSGKTMGVQQSSSMVSEYQVMDAALSAESGKGFARTLQYQSYPEMKLALSIRQIDATVLPLPMAAHWMKRSPGQFKIAGEWSTDKEAGHYHYAWAVRKSDITLRKEIDRIIESMEQDGLLDELQVKWFGKRLRDLESIGVVNRPG